MIFTRSLFQPCYTMYFDENCYLLTTPQKGEGEKKFCVRILCKKQHLANTRTHFRQLITTRDPMREGEGLVAIL